MFEKFKEIAKLKQMQSEFKREKLTFENKGVTVVMNGNFEIEDIKLNPDLNIDQQQDALKYCLNRVREDIQKTLAQKMMGAGFGL